MVEATNDQKNIFSLSTLLNIEPKILLRLCQYIESRGYFFSKSEEGTLQFNDRDIAVILAHY
ncbi:hypothetical protein M5X11_02310 [Paenibacillus alginolyticus]|jgi:hypothetical protein|uniref:Uncharacterized protein n=1 Tax=Paenibacillus alginolyticus TaxID=59839 RepID=A0ABT4GDS0_9BACL|nr:MULTISPECIES: hypothetical protein [Paenibacillus]MCY9663820.1 hypothetical protein [Paenibacillus alginolyticus]MCY9694331.1 hypothetical protein [Paenibacillus alginolyticus]MEC0142882.1 hypothetical protein [Paenibacillus alginolyticus]NRF91554.1 hypothetical protein [Paenibacillus frigoriresistens]